MKAKLKQEKEKLTEIEKQMKEYSIELEYFKSDNIQLKGNADAKQKEIEQLKNKMKQ